MPAGAAQLELIAGRDGTRLRLRVKPGARRSAILAVHGGALKLAVAAAPERGRANRAVLELLGSALGLAPTTMTLVAGESSADKTVLVPLTVAELRSRLDAALAPVG